MSCTTTILAYHSFLCIFFYLSSLTRQKMRAKGITSFFYVAMAGYYIYQRVVPPPANQISQTITCALKYRESRGLLTSEPFLQKEIQMKTRAGLSVDYTYTYHVPSESLKRRLVRLRRSEKTNEMWPRVRGVYAQFCATQRARCPVL